MGAELKGEQKQKTKQRRGVPAELMGCSAATWRKEMEDWVMHWQAILQLQHLSWQERCRIATQTSMREMLDFTRVKILNDPNPPGAFRRLHEHLKGVREAKSEGVEQVSSGDESGQDVPGMGCSHQHEDGGHQRSEDRAQLLTSRNVVCENSVAGVGSEASVFQVLSEDCSGSEFSGQVFLQLMRIVAQEMGLRMSTLDMMLLELEHFVTVA
jgi:hypothetical protein